MRFTTTHRRNAAHPAGSSRFGRCVRLLMLVSWLYGPVQGQPLPFGSADDPREELQVVWWRMQSSFDAAGGLSLISNHWRAAASASASIVTEPLTAHFSGTLRGGIYGGYGPDADELYDVLRLVDFARYHPRPTLPLYVRVGLIERMRLGTGHVVNFFNSRAAWDRRTVGFESMLSRTYGDMAVFVDDVLLGGVFGGRGAVRPFVRSTDLRLQTLEVGLNYVVDRGTSDAASGRLSAYNVDVKFDVLEWGAIRLSPFGSFAWYPEYGSGLGFGAALESLDFVDLVRFRLRMGLYYNGREFIPGYVGSFYHVNNPTARILDSEDYLERNRRIDYEGVALANALGGHDLETDLRLLIFERFEFWYYFRRHYGTQSLSEYHLRLFLRLSDRFRLDTGIDRGGLKGFFTLFSDFGDQTALVFGTDYRLSGPLWLFIRSRYTFERVGTGEDGIDRYLIQRRFEPFSGLRFTW